jgi:hypothetical protein
MPLAVGSVAISVTRTATSIVPASSAFPYAVRKLIADGISHLMLLGSSESRAAPCTGTYQSRGMALQHNDQAPLRFSTSELAAIATERSDVRMAAIGTRIDERAHCFGTAVHSIFVVILAAVMNSSFIARLSIWWRSACDR